MFEKKTSPNTILCCAPDPDSRRSICKKLSGQGYQVIATGNPQIASGLLQEQSYCMLVLCLEQLRISFISILVDARRSKPDMAVVVIFNQQCRDNIPSGLADQVLIQPDERDLGLALKSLTEAPVRPPTHGALTTAP